MVESRGQGPIVVVQDESNDNFIFYIYAYSMKLTYLGSTVKISRGTGTSFHFKYSGHVSPLFPPLYPPRWVYLILSITLDFAKQKTGNFLSICIYFASGNSQSLLALQNIFNYFS